MNKWLKLAVLVVAAVVVTQLLVRGEPPRTLGLGRAAARAAGPRAGSRSISRSSAGRWSR